MLHEMYGHALSLSTIFFDFSRHDLLTGPEAPENSLIFGLFATCAMALTDAPGRD
jgi:hypothetical protein